MTFGELKETYAADFLTRRNEFMIACDRHDSKAALEALTEPIVLEHIASVKIASIPPDDFVITKWDGEAKCWLFRYSGYTCRIFSLGKTDWYIINIPFEDRQLTCPQVFGGFSNLSKDVILSEEKRNVVIDCVDKYLADEEA